MFENEPEITLENFDALAHYYDRMIQASVYDVYKFVKHSVDRDDLHQEALITLFKCIQKYDPTRGVFFNIYLKRSIMNGLNMYCREYVPGHYIKDPNKPGKFLKKNVHVDSFQQKFERWNTDDL